MSSVAAPRLPFATLGGRPIFLRLPNVGEEGHEAHPPTITAASCGRCCPRPLRKCALSRSIRSHSLCLPKSPPLISSPAAMTRRRRGRRRHSASRPIGSTQQQAMRLPGGLIRRASPWPGCARSIPRYGFPISGVCSRFADRKTSRDTKSASEKLGCRSD